METYGFIHERLDIKILILFVLRHLPAPVDPETLADLILIDGGINYFEYKQCLTELITTHQVEERDGLCVITAQGKENGATLESSLPISVRNIAEETLAPVARALQRDSLICTEHTNTENGTVVRLSLSDGVSNILELKILAGDEKQAKVMEKNFRKDAEGFYDRFINSLCE